MSGTFEERVRQTIQIMGEGWEHLSIRFSIIDGLAAVRHSRNQAFNPCQITMIVDSKIWQIVALEKIKGLEEDLQDNLFIFGIKKRGVKEPDDVMAYALSYLKLKTSPSLEPVQSKKHP